MGGNTSQNVELAWEGVVGIQTAAVVAALLVLLTTWALWRERDAVGRGWTAAFWVLRMVAFGFALWMLAGPTLLHIRRTTNNQSIAIFADVSESMDVVDPAEVGDSVRWALTVSGDADRSPVARCDRMTVALGAALDGCEQLSQYVAEHRSAEQLRGLIASIGGAADRAMGHAEAVLAAVDGRDSALADRASRVAALLEGPVAESLAAIRLALDAPQQTGGEDVAVRLETLRDNVVSARRRAIVLAADLAQRPDAAATPGRSEVDRLSRREKEGRALDAFEREMEDHLAADVRVRRYQFVAAPVPVTADRGWNNVFDRETAATNLSAVLEQLAGERSSESTRLAIIWSDGHHNDPTAALPQEVATGLANLPIYFVPTGNSALLRDIVLHRVEAPSAVAEKDQAVIDIIVTGFECDGDAVDVVLRHEGVEVERQPVEFSGDRSDARIRFTVRADEVGRQEYIVEVEPLEDEANSANNYLPVAFDVVRDQIRVLLADSVARWEFRYLSQLFRRDTHVDCDELLFFPRVVGTGRLAQRPELPRDVAGWASYDVVILGDLDARQLTVASQQSLDEFVRTRGGNLLVIAGRGAMPSAFTGSPLIGLLPVEYAGQVDPPQGYGLRLTDEGRFHSAMMIADSEVESRQAWQRIYRRQAVHWLSEYSRAKSTARTLIEASTSGPDDGTDDRQAGGAAPAFLCWHRVGAGRVVFLAAPDTYRLRFLQGDRMHHRFWGQLLRWITAAGAGTGTDLVRLQTDRMRYAAGEPVEVTVWLKDKTGQPLAGQTIQAESRTFDDVAVSMELAPDAEVAGRYFAVMPELPEGAYQVAVRGPVIDELLASDPDTELVRATITVRASDNVEMLNTQCNRALLEQLAQMTGGQVVPPTAVGEVLQLISFAPEVVEHTERTPLWNRWSNMLIVLGCLFTEWVVRKAKGLV